MGGACGTYGGEEQSVRGFDAERSRKLLCRPRHRWENDIKISVQALGLEGVGCVNLV